MEKWGKKGHLVELVEIRNKILELGIRIENENWEHELQGKVLEQFRWNY